MRNASEAPEASSAAVVELQRVVPARYEVLRALGKGGMARVFLAKDKREAERLVALKVSSRAFASGAYAERFERENWIGKQLKSPHVVRFLDFGTLADGRAYIALEYLEGRDLHELFEARAPLPVEEAAGYILQVCEALAELHAHNIIHRDLSLANIFLTSGVESPRIKVLDFGVALAQNHDKRLTVPEGGAPANPVCAAPEQLDPKQQADHRTDIWACGVALYALLTGTCPFDSTQGVYSIFVQAPPRPSSLNPGIPPGLEAVILKCLARERSDRYPSALDLARALAPYAL